MKIRGKQPFVSAAQRAHLSEWLNEWRLDQRLKSAPPEAAGGDEAPGLPPSAQRTDAVGQSGARMPRSVAEEPFPAPGQVRLLHPDVLPGSEDPVYVAVLAEWEQGLLLASPFSPCSSPASSGELAYPGHEDPLKVLELWNTTTALPFQLAESWLVTELTARERDDAWKAFAHIATGAPLPKRLQDRVGPPIVHALDPRIEFQTRQAALMAPLVAQAARALELRVGDAELTTLRATAEELNLMPLAAADPGSQTCLVATEPAPHARLKAQPIGRAKVVQQVTAMTVPADYGRCRLKLTVDGRPDWVRNGTLTQLVGAGSRLIGFGRLVSVPDGFVADLMGEWDQLRDCVESGDLSAYTLILLEPPPEP
jgi:hypothetical protein